MKNIIFIIHIIHLKIQSYKILILLLLYIKSYIYIYIYIYILILKIEYILYKCNFHNM